MTSLTGAAAAICLALFASAADPRPLPEHIASAAAHSDRRQDVEDDARRRGPEILAFAKVRKGDRVIDLIPGGAYWTRLFAKAVGPRGRVYGIWPEPYAQADKANVERYRVMAASAAFANVSLSVQPAASVAAPEKADLVFTSLNYHDYPDAFMGSVPPAKFNRAVLGALKRCGRFVVIDHQAASGTGLRDIATLHRIEGAAVKAQVVAAGFEFEAESPLLANPADDRTKPVFDPAVRGRTDQFVYRFRKPC